MVTTEDRTARLENKIDGIDGRVGRTEGSQEQMSNRLDDIHNLHITLIAIGGGGLITAVVSLVLQLVNR